MPRLSQFRKLHPAAMMLASISLTALLIAGIIGVLQLGGALGYFQYESLHLAWLDSQKLNTLFSTCTAIGAFGSGVFTIVPAFRALFNLKKAKAQKETKRNERNELRIRLALIERVRTLWVSGKLEKSLHNRLLIELNKEECLDMVDYPWQMVFETQCTSRKKLPSSMTISDVFQQCGKSMLILGDPGAGKTTMLLELARYAVDCAEKDMMQPIPIILNLSSWLNDDETIQEWIISELASSLYRIPRKIAEFLVHNNRLLLLLDGFDEIDLKRREACIKAINNFRNSQGLCPIVICSRAADYIRLSTRLQMQGAITLQPLSPKQIQDYLSKLGDDLLGLSLAIRRNHVLADLAKSPFRLNLMILTYSGVNADSIKLSYPTKKSVNDLIALYIDRVMKRPRLNNLYTTDETIQWLSWIAKNIPQRIFLMDRLQPFLLGRSINRYFHVILLLMGFASYFYLRSNLLLIGRILGDRDISELVVLVLYCLPPHIGLAFMQEAKKGIRLVETWRWSWEKAEKVLLRSFILLAFIILLIWLSIEFRPMIKRIIMESILFGGLQAALLAFYIWHQKRLGLGWPYFGFWDVLFFRFRKIIRIDGKRYIEIDRRKVEKRKQEPFYYYNKRIFLTTWLIAGVVIGLIPLLIADYVHTPHNEVIPNLIKTAQIAIAITAVLIPLLIFISGLSFYEHKEKIIPNQGIWLSRKNFIRTLVLALMIGLPAFASIDRVAVGSWPVVISNDPFFNRPLQILILTLTVAILLGMLFGGFACIQHYVLRAFLIIRGNTPWRYRNFLDFAVDRVLLREVGGGYEFIHDSVREYFASLDADAPQSERGPSGIQKQKHTFM